MNLYLDTSVVVKRHLVEPESSESIEIADRAVLVGTSLICAAEVAAAFSRAVRLGSISSSQGQQLHRSFLSEWPAFERIPVSEEVVSLASRLAWDHSLRGYDAVHLASALLWQRSIGHPVTVATYDRELWKAVEPAGLHPWPSRLPR